MAIRGIRGATSVAKNNRVEIINETKKLLQEIVATNNLNLADIASVIFTVTADLDAEFPAVAARELGWSETALLCAREIDVPDSLPKIIRILMHVNSEKEQNQIKNIYLKEAKKLRR